MKVFIAILTLLFAVTGFTKSNPPQVKKTILSGPSFFKLGSIKADSELIQIVKGPKPLLSSPIVAGNKEISHILEELAHLPKGEGVATISCVGDTVVNEKFMKINKIKICVRISDGDVLVQSQDLSPQEIARYREEIDDFLM